MLTSAVPFFFELGLTAEA